MNESSQRREEIEGGRGEREVEEEKALFISFAGKTNNDCDRKKRKKYKI